MYRPLVTLQGENVLSRSGMAFSIMIVAAESAN